MSNNVDRRVVEMQFDNKDFEKRVQTSVKTLDSLKKSLDFKESAKGLSALEKAGKRFDLNGVAAAAEAVTSKFSVMGTIGDQMLRKIGDSAFNALHKMKGFVDSLTIEPIFSGKQEYETQINAIQTILSNTRDKLTKQGYSDAERLDIVNDRLDTLNHYADKTIYNFTEMTRNIGTFTAAGVELDTAVQSIQGIANLAAVSGSTSEQASRGMYQLSQAISTGTVKLMDWNSVVNAGMGGELFQKALIRTATAMNVTVDKTVTEVNKRGKKIKKTVKKNAKELVEEAGSFRESLSDGWLTADVLTATLEQFSWDFEQMAKDMGYTAANMEEGIAKAMDSKRTELLAQGYSADEAEEIIQLAKDATEAATKVKTFTQLFDTLKEAAQSGWTQTWEYIIGDFNEAKEMLTGISDFFGKIIESSAEARNQLMKEWHDAGGRDMLFNNDPNKGTLGAFWNVVYGIQNVVRMVREEFQKIFPPATSKTLLSFTEKIQTATANFKAWTENSDGMDKLRRIMAGIGSALGVIRSGISYVWNGFKNWFGLTKSAGNGLLDFAAGLGDSIVKMKESIKTSDTFRQFLNRVSDAAASVRAGMLAAFNAGRAAFAKLCTKLKDSGILTKIGEGISDFINRIPMAISQLKAWGKGIIDYAKQSEMLKTAWENIRKFFEPAIKGIADFGKRFRDSLDSLFSKDSDNGESIGEKLKSRLSAVGSGFGSWLETVKDGVDNAWKSLKSYLSNFFTKTIPEFFHSRQFDVGSIVEKLQAIDWTKLVKTVFGVTSFVKTFQILNNFSKIGKIGDAFNNLSKALKTIAKNGASLTKEGLFINGKSKRTPIGETLLKIAASIGVLVASVYVLAKMDGKSLAKGMGMIALLAGEMAAISIVIHKTQVDGGSILKMSAAILLLVAPIKLLSQMPIAKAAKGMIGIGLILTELVLAMRMMPEKFNGKNASFIGMSVAINVLVVAVKNLATLDIGGLAKGLLGLGALLLEMALFLKKRGNIKGIGGMVGMAVAVNLLATAVKRIGRLNAKTIIKGVLGLGGIMTAFSVMIKTTKGVKMGNSLVLLLSMAGSLFLFVEVFKKIEGTNTDDMVKFAASLSATLLSLSVTMKVISMIPISGALTGLAGFAILIAGIGGIITALGWLEDKSEGLLTGFLENGGNVLERLGNAIGRFIGGIGAGVVTGANLPSIGEQLSQFYTNAEPFLTGIASLEVPDNTFWENLIGATDLYGFAKSISPFVEGLKAYATELSGFETDVSEDTNKKVISVAKSLSEFAQTVPENTFLENLTGITDLNRFTSDIPGFANGMIAYADALSGFDKKEISEDTNKKVISVAKSLSEFAQIVPDTSFWENLTGMTDFNTFSNNISDFGAGLNRYAENTKGIGSLLNANDVSILSSTMASLGDLLQKIQSFSAEYSDLYTVGNGLGSFGAHYKTFVTDVNDAGSLNNQHGVIDAVTSFSEVATAMSTVSKAFDLGNYMWQMAADIERIAGISVNESQITAISSLIRAVSESMTSIDPTIDTEQISEKFRSLLTNIHTIVAPEWSQNGQKDAQSYTSGLTDGVLAEAAVAAFTGSVIGLSSEGTSAAYGTYKTWHASGQSLALGLSAGINSMASVVRASSVSVAAGAIQSIRMTWAVNSPSKVGENLAMYFDLGIAGGLRAYAKVVDYEAANVGTSAVESVRTMLHGMNGSIFDDIDPNPTIRPVLDLTSIQNGVGILHGMLDPNQLAPIGLFRGLNSIRGINGLNFDGNKIAGGLTDKNIVTKLDTLQAKIAELGEAVTNMKIVLDSGELVGATSRKIDNSLGTLSMRRERGN